MSLTADLIRPRDSLPTEEEIHGSIQTLGRATGANYERIWDPRERLVEVLAAYFTPKADELAATVGGSHYKNHIANVALFVLGLTVFILLCVSANSYSWDFAAGFLFLIWLGISWGWLYSLYRYRKAINATKATVAERQNWLVVVGIYAALEVIAERQSDARDHTPANDPALPFTPQGTMPPPQPFGVSHEGAEALCAEWMRFYGEADAEVTQFTADGGIDVTSLHYIAQVKNYSGTVGVEAIREMAGTSLDNGRKALFFTSGRYASGAITFADRTAIPLFTYDAVAGTLSGANQHAERIFQTGL